MNSELRRWGPRLEDGKCAVKKPGLIAVFTCNCLQCHCLHRLYTAQCVSVQSLNLHLSACASFAFSSRSQPLPVPSCVAIFVPTALWIQSPHVNHRANLQPSWWPNDSKCPKHSTIINSLATCSPRACASVRPQVHHCFHIGPVFCQLKRLKASMQK